MHTNTELLRGLQWPAMVAMAAIVAMAKRATMATMATIATMDMMATMAAIATMATMATVLSSMGIRECGHRMTCPQNSFGMCTESTLAGVLDEFRSKSSKHHRRSSGQHLYHPGIFEAISKTRRLVASHSDRPTVWYLDRVENVGR